MLYAHCHRLSKAPAPLRVSYNKLSPSRRGRGRGRQRPGCGAVRRPSSAADERAAPGPPGAGDSHPARPPRPPGLPFGATLGSCLQEAGIPTQSGFSRILWTGAPRPRTGPTLPFAPPGHTPCRLHRCGCRTCSSSSSGPSPARLSPDPFPAFPGKSLIGYVWVT